MFLRCNPTQPLRSVAVQTTRRNAPLALRPGFTLLEMVVAMTIMVIVMGSLGAMAKAVNEGALYGETYGSATQHARVAMQRIGATVRSATTSDDFPGLIVIERTVGGWTFPDILVVWHPDGAPVDPDGLPRVNELRVYCPNPDAPNELLEVTFPADSRVVPAPSDTVAWRTEAAAMMASESGVRTVLTDMLRTAQVTSLAASLRGAICFHVRYRPTEDEMTAYEAGTTDWDDLAWPQGIYTDNVGLRQAWLRMELQLVPQSTSVGAHSSDETAIPFLGSASRFFEVHP